MSTLIKRKSPAKPKAGHPTSVEPTAIYSITSAEASAILTALGDCINFFDYANNSLAIPPVIEHLDWERYEAFLRAIGSRALRHSYDRGTLEMAPLEAHEWVKHALGRMIEAICVEWDIPCIATGSTTFRRRGRRRGFEPDLSFYLNVEAARYDIGTSHGRQGPGPDLVVEIDQTASSVSRMPLFAATGVKEVWRWRKGKLEFHRLGRNKKYTHVARSGVLPGIVAEDLQPFVERFRGASIVGGMRAFQSWLRSRKKPRE